MKHDNRFPVDHLRQRGLPEAPLVMPRQILERSFDWTGVFRLLTFVRLRRG